MGGSVGDFFDDVGDAIGDAFGDFGDFAADVWHGAVNVVEDVAHFVGNIIEGVSKDIFGMAKGLITGDWVEFRDSALGVLNAAIGIVATVVGVLLTPLNPMVGTTLIAAGITMLDAQYNGGEILGNVINTAAGIETAIFNSHIIEEHAYIIQAAITVGASLYAGYMAGPIVLKYLAEASGIAAMMEQYRSALNVLGGMYGSYQIYGAIQSIIASQEYWKAKLAEYEAALAEWERQLSMARNQWFEMMTNTDLINRIMPGGDLFSMGAGHELMSVTSVAEPRYMLGLMDTSDADMDRLMNNRYYAQYAGSEGFKIK